MTGEEHNKYIAYIFLAHGGLQLLMLLLLAVMFFVFLSVPMPPGEPGPPPAFFGVFFALMFIFQTVFTTPSFIAAYALLKRKNWARIASIIAAVLAAMSVPVGTAACVYALWFFFGDEWKGVYGEEGFDQARQRQQLQPGSQWQWQGGMADEFEFQPEKRSEPPDWR